MESFLSLDCHQLNTMLPRTVVLLLLCVSTGMCATLGHYQAEGKEGEEEEALTVTSATVTEGAASSVGDSPAAEEPVANRSFGEKLLGKILAVDNPAADKHEVADGAPAEEPGTDSDGPARDIPAMDALAEEAVNQKQPSAEEEEQNEIRPIKTQSLDKPLANEEQNSWSLNSIRSSFQTVHGYFDSLVELVGGHNGVCQYRCRYGKSESYKLIAILLVVTKLLCVCSLKTLKLRFNKFYYQISHLL